MWLKTLILFLFIYWIGQRLLRIFQAVGNDGAPDQKTRSSSKGPDQIIPDDKGEYIDYEEVD